MGYNQGLAVGLGVGVPCLIVFVGLVYFYTRSKRLQREEDLHGNDLDVEMGDNGSFKEFGEALHRPADSQTHTPRRDMPAAKSARQAHVDMDRFAASKSASSSDSVGNSVSNPTTKPNSLTHPHSRESALKSHSSPTHRKPSFNGLHGDPHNPTSSNRRSPGRTNSAYDFYDSVIPIMATENTPDSALAQPPSLGGAAERTSLQSSHGSLIGSDAQTRSLDNLAKQLQNPQIFATTPSRASTTLARPNSRAVAQSPSKRSSVTDFEPRFDTASFTTEQLANEKLILHEHSQQHPYREMVAAHRDPGTIGLESNFDNHINTEKRFSPEPDVVFK
ncbi:hypothetical protein JCM33374_g2859 [Metschnikowia sp. JCM 33374]|nr:hypothetical protein JCM33374_g2859 [Metschnikowia sp. JCM 33374]